MQGWQIDFDGLRRREDFYGDLCFFFENYKEEQVGTFF